jgi:RNA polymerase sigma factor (sigma-70 family)
MPRRPPSPLLQYLRDLGGGPAAGQVTDRELLERFAARRDEAAFAALLRRHGPMVRGVCRRVLRLEQDVEDAFQATFLVLARKARALRWESAVGPWLYQVAYRVARKARTAAARRLARERRAPDRPPDESMSAADWRELRAVLDEEVNRLPSKYRVPLVLCYLDGKTNQEAAGELGWTKGTVSGRLARARELLRSRLARRGLNSSSAALAASLARQSLSPGLPASVARATVEAAVRVAAGPGPGTVPDPVASLVRGALRELFWARLRNAAAVFLVVAVLGPAAGALGHRALSAPPVAAKKEEVGPAARAEQPPAAGKEARAPQPAAKGDEPRPAALWREQPSLQVCTGMIHSLALSPDGKWLVSSGSPRIGEGIVDLYEDAILWDTFTGKKQATLARLARMKEWGQAPSIVFAPDGKALALIGEDLLLWDVATRKVRSTLRTGDVLHTRGGVCPVVNAEPICFSGDGKTIAARGSDGKVRVYDVDTGKRQATLQASACMALSPDGKALIAVRGLGGDPALAELTVTVWEVATGKVQKTHRFKGGDVRGLALAPDGKALAVASSDSTVQVWDVGTEELRATLGKRQAPMPPWPAWAYLVFSPDGQSLVCCGGGANAAVTVWDLATGQGQVLTQGWAPFLTFAADSRALAVGYYGGTVRRWAVGACPPPARPEPPRGGGA